MIPKIIHYYYDKTKPNSRRFEKCIASWKRSMSQYKFINWANEDFDFNCCEFMKYCKDNNLTCFYSHYIRFWALYNYGGIYLDTDVMVNKTFGALLHLKRMFTYQENFKGYGRLDAGIIACEKNDKAIGYVIDWYNQLSDKFEEGSYVDVCDVMQNVIFTKFRGNVHDSWSLKDLDLNEDSINIYNVKYFSKNNNESFCYHCFIAKQNKNEIKNDKIQIFLCAHKPIENYIPDSPYYTIMDVSGTADDGLHNYIDISDDEFVKEHNVCYGEGCAIRYLYNHQDLLPEYVCFGHYRRMPLDFIDREFVIPRYVESYGAVINTPLKFTTTECDNNYKTACHDHYSKEIRILRDTIKEVAPEYYPAFNEFSLDNYFYGRNCFAMKKEDFIEMCEMCFMVLDAFDKKFAYKNNDDVYERFEKLSKKNKLKLANDNIEWHSRLQGFLLEYLTDTYYRKKFGVDNCYKAFFDMPIRIVNSPNDVNFYNDSRTYHG